VITFVSGASLLSSCSDAAPPKKDAAARDTGSSISPAPTDDDPFDPVPTPPRDAGNNNPPTGQCDRNLDLSRIQGCDRFIANARACADNSDLQPYPFTDTRSRDVVTCNTTATCVEHCAVRCARMPDGFPDECDQCTGKPDGNYCGRELNWSTRNLDVLVRCENGTLDTSPTPQRCNLRCEVGSTQGTARCVN
jgi:hypothetical protein